MTKADDAIQTGRAKIRVSEYPASTTGQSVVIERSKGTHIMVTDAEVEAVAKSIWLHSTRVVGAALGGNFDAGAAWLLMEEDTRELFYRRARAAISAYEAVKERG